MAFEVKLDYPGYTQRKDEKLESIGDLVVPQGTVIDWVFNAQHTSVFDIKFSRIEDRVEAERFSDELFTYRRKAMLDETYKLILSNEELEDAYKVNYAIRVIPDQYPSISVEEFIDSLETKVSYFIGEASDDYGLQNLSFIYQIKKADGTELEPVVESIAKPEWQTSQLLTCS